jgi:hypothetical protein
VGWWKGHHSADASEKSGAEVSFWLRHFLYCCLDVYSDAAKAYATKYCLAEAVAAIEQETLLVSARLKKIDNEHSQLQNASNIFNATAR